MRGVTVGHDNEPPGAAGIRILMEIQTATWRWAALRALVTIGALETLAARPLTIDQLASSCGASAAVLKRVPRCVAATGLLRSFGRHEYELTDTCRAAMDGWAFASLRYTSDPEIWDALGEIAETIRTGQAPFVARRGSVYDYLLTQPATAGAFDALMKDTFSPVARSLAQAVDFAKLESVVDVGGGYGGFITAILQAHPGTRGILAELDRALPGARDYLTANGVADRCEVVACDFFVEPLPSGADAYLLAHVIHNWNDEQALTILRAVRAAIPDHGRLLLVEVVLPDDDGPDFAKDLDIHLLTIAGGGERTESEYSELIAEAGFCKQAVIGLSGQCAMAAIPRLTKGAPA